MHKGTMSFKVFVEYCAKNKMSFVLTGDKSAWYNLVVTLPSGRTLNSGLQASIERAISVALSFY